jgi:hypothetical protein
MKARRQFSALRHGGYLSAAALVLFFVAASPPHRVHHFFEQGPSRLSHGDVRVEAHGQLARNDDQNHRPQRQPAPNRSDCVVLFAAQHAQTLSGSLFELPLIEFTVSRNPARFVKSTSFFDPSPCAQRAPPLV